MLTCIWPDCDTECGTSLTWAYDFWGITLAHPIPFCPSHGLRAWRATFMRMSPSQQGRWVNR